MVCKNMTIPNDPLGRCWAEVSNVNPELVNSFRHCLIAFLAFHPNKQPQLAGTGFIMAGSHDSALVITAKHVLAEMVPSIQQPSPAYYSASPFVNPNLKPPSSEPEKLKIYWGGSKHSGLLNMQHACYNDKLDIAYCIVTPQELHAAPFQPISIPIDTTIPSVGDVVHMVSQDGLDVSELEPPTEASGKGQTILINRPVSIRIGTVTGIYPQGLRRYTWPCFTTSIPAEPGMSGGFVYLPRDGKSIAACGIVCADNPTEEARTNCLQCGESVVACAWPVLALPIPESIPAVPNTLTRTLYDMMQTGDIPMAASGIDNFELVDLGNGDHKIGFR